jgi:hypothetical protein
LLEDGGSGCSARMTYPKALLHCADGLVPPDNATAALALYVQDNVYQRESRRRRLKGGDHSYYGRSRVLGCWRESDEGVCLSLLGGQFGERCAETPFGDSAA